MTEVEPLRRSLLYLAGAYPEMLGNFPAFTADLFCFDLEDGTPPPEKIVARERIARALSKPDPAGRERLLRVNGLDTPWGHDDLTFAATLPIDGVLLPKVEGAGAVRQALNVLDAAGAPKTLAIWCLIETPLGVLRAEEIASSSVRVAGLVIGGSDLAETTRARQTANRLPQLTALSHCILAARAYGLAIIDAVHPNYRNEEGFAESCARAVELGFDGKSIALPSTIAIANAVFAPSSEEIEAARAQLAVAGDAQSGYANLHLLHAHRLIARANQIADQEALMSSFDRHGIAGSETA